MQNVPTYNSHTEFKEMKNVGGFIKKLQTGDFLNFVILNIKVKVKVIPQQAEVAQGVPGRLRHRIFLTFGTTRVVCRQPYAPAAFTPGEIPGTHFQGLSRPQGTWFCRGEPRKKFPVTPPGNDPGSVRLVEQCLNHYSTPGTTNGPVVSSVAVGTSNIVRNYQLFHAHLLSVRLPVLEIIKLNTGRGRGKGKGKGKGKAITVETWTGPEGSRRLRLPDVMINGIRRR